MWSRYIGRRLTGEPPCPDAYLATLLLFGHVTISHAYTLLLDGPRKPTVSTQTAVAAPVAFDPSVVNSTQYTYMFYVHPNADNGNYLDTPTTPPLNIFSIYHKPSSSGKGQQTLSVYMNPDGSITAKSFGGASSVTTQGKCENIAHDDWSGIAVRRDPVWNVLDVFVMPGICRAIDERSDDDDNDDFCKTLHMVETSVAAPQTPLPYFDHWTFAETCAAPAPSDVPSVARLTYSSTVCGSACICKRMLREAYALCSFSYSS